MEIKPYAKNAKKHPKKQIEQIAKSIEVFGMNQPIVVDKNGVIIVGHGRYEALQHLGWELKPEWVTTLNISEEKARAYRLADNKLNESDWDMELVFDELDSLTDEIRALTGFDDEDSEDEEKEKHVNEAFEVIVECQNLGHQEQIFNELTAKGYTCRLLNL